MKEIENKKYLIVFLVLIGLILVLIVYNISINQKQKNVNRKVEHIFNYYTYDDVYNKGSILFNNSIKLVINDFEYEKNENAKDKYFSIYNFNQYKRIINFQLINSTLSYKEITKYLDSREIVIDSNKYYIKNYNKISSNYIGSIIEIDSYDNKYVYFKSENYYCDNYEYLGVIDEKPSCEYKITNTKFTIILEDNILKMNDLNEIAEIMT